MALITLLDAQLGFGHVPLLDHAGFSLEPQERVGLIGRNGTGKSTLLKILASLEKPDDGSLQVQNHTRIAYVAQEPVLDPASSVFDAASLGLARVRQLIEDYSQGHGDLDRMQSEIEALDGWNWEQRVSETLHRLHLDPAALISTLSGGTKKRVALAQALVAQPDVLLLDEPTNHLDLDSIEWLEGLLVEFKGSIVVITHDRTFLDKVATRIVELDRGKLSSYPGNFAAYLTQKQEQLAQEAVINASCACKSCAPGTPPGARPPAACRWTLPAAHPAASWCPNSPTSANISASAASCAISAPPSCAATRSACSGPTARAKPRSSS